MVDKAITKYVKDYLQKGYSVSAIRAYLLRYGYSSNDVDEAISKATGNEVKHVVHVSRSALILGGSIAGALALIAVVVFLIFSIQQPPQKLLDLEVEVMTSQVQPGDFLEFNTELINQGAKQRYDVVVSYNVVNSDTGSFLTNMDKTIAVETVATSKTTVQIPESASAGNYVLKANTRYDGKTATASFAFRVIKPAAQPTCSDGIQNQGEAGVDCGGPCPSPCAECPASCDDENPCTEDKCSDLTDFQCRHVSIPLCCGNGVCEAGEDENSCPEDCRPSGDDPFAGMTDWQKVDAIRDLSYTDPERAGRLCQEIEYETARNACYHNLAEVTKVPQNCELIIGQRGIDNCYSNLAQVGDDYEMCTYVSKESRRDSCYMGYAMEYKDFSICDRVINDQLRQSCEALSQLHSPEYQQAVNKALSTVGSAAELPSNATAEDYRQVIQAQVPG
ncbi:hypothetical protein GF351_00830 [Candidatus Woesearchaeota archaeon]|nr:hypothetical protein [Candidatus Woesearchaeota archaeon]